MPTVRIMSTWLVVFKSDGLAELGVMVHAADVLAAISSALEQWTLGDVRDVVKVERA
jgi:hypothetical protein